jgi:hypothetical protein
MLARIRDLHRVLALKWSHLQHRKIRRSKQFKEWRPPIFPNPAFRPAFSQAIPLFLTETDSQTEIAVTHSKQTGGTSLTGARTDFRNRRPPLAF